MRYTKAMKTAYAGNTIPILIGVSVFALLATAAAVWGIASYIDQKTDVDGRVSQAVTDATKKQQDELEATFAAREKEPNRTFYGPDDFGRLIFMYPKTWSVYVSKEATSGGTYEAYLNPISVPPINSKTQYALRVTIETRDYDQVIKSYSSLVDKGSLKSSAYTNKGNSGTRLDGNFSTDIRGSAVVIKIRDKTATIRTDANTFKADFDALIQTIEFNN